MTAFPLRLRALGEDDVLFVNDGGRFFAAGSGFLRRVLERAFSMEDLEFLKREGHAIDEIDVLANAAHLYALAERRTLAAPLDYLILVPTLRCNLSCSYCQVSRANLYQPGYDWSEDTLSAVLDQIDRLDTAQIKVEFQGGEPTLRPDLIRAVIDRCTQFDECQFVICTNLQRIDAEVWALFDRDDVYISTSLDGDAATHRRNRTSDAHNTDAFLSNLTAVLARYGPTKVSALPTIDAAAPPDPDVLIDTYAELGLNSIFLRPINYQGFARKRHGDSREQSHGWRDYHEAFVRRLIERNWRDRTRVLDETYFSICLRRVFQPGADRHVDLRDPNPLGQDYVVMDFDGRVYPTDEARMLSRSGVIDLAIGDVWNGWDSAARDQMNAHCSNREDPTCQRCVYQPYCGRDLIDDIARYGRIDMPRHETEFCRRHLHMFDLIFTLIYEDNPAVTYSLSRWLSLDGTPNSLGVRWA